MIGGKTFVRLPSTNLFLAIKGGNGNPFDFVLQQLSTAINTGPSYLLGIFLFLKRSREFVQLRLGAQREPILTSLQKDICSGPR